MTSAHDGSPIVPLTQEQGERTDAVVQVGYDPGSSWRALRLRAGNRRVDGDREENGRIGVGGSYRITERLRIDAEISDGDLGAGGRIGSNYLYSERTNLYLNYALENERTDNGLPARGSRQSRIRREAAAIRQLERLSRGALPGQRLGFRADACDRHQPGRERALEPGCQCRHRHADGLADRRRDRPQRGRRPHRLRVRECAVSSGIEYRIDESEQPDTVAEERTTWLLRNNVKYQLTPDWRVVGKFNHSDSESSLGEFYDGGYTEAVVGYAYRPVRNDRLNALPSTLTSTTCRPRTRSRGAECAAEFVQKSHIARPGPHATT